MKELESKEQSGERTSNQEVASVFLRRKANDLDTANTDRAWAAAEIERLTVELAAMTEDRNDYKLAAESHSEDAQENRRLRAALERAVKAMNSVTIFVTSRERIKRPEGENWWTDEIRAASSAEHSTDETGDDPARAALLRASAVDVGSPPDYARAWNELQVIISNELCRQNSARAAQKASDAQG